MAIDTALYRLKTLLDSQLPLSDTDRDRHLHNQGQLGPRQHPAPRARSCHRGFERYGRFASHGRSYTFRNTTLTR